MAEIQRLIVQEPSSCEEVYHHFNKALEKCSMMINDAEADYYQSSFREMSFSPEKKQSWIVSTLTSWSEQLNEIRESRLLRDIRNGKTIRELLSEAKSGLLYGSFTDEGLAVLKRVLDKTNEQLYMKFPAIGKQIEDIMNTMERYFLSFYDIDHIEDIIEKKRKETPSEKYLENVYNYEKSRWLHMFEVNKCLKVIREMHIRVEDPKGVILSTFSKETQELASRSECSFLSYVFALPECYHLARQALIELKHWIGEDDDYNDFVQKSLKTIEDKCVEATKDFETSKRNLTYMEHRADSYRLQLRKMEEEDKINEKKLEDFEKKQNSKEREYVSRRLTYEVHIEQLAKLIAESESGTSQIDNRLSIERFQKDIKQLTKDVAKLKSQLDVIRGRMDYFEQRKKEFQKMREDMIKFDADVQNTLEDKILKENHFNRMQNCRKTLIHIYKCRTTDDLPQKIFHGLPVKSKHNIDDDDDNLSKAFRLIAKSIGREWNRLYWELPFYPVRGQEELAKDVKSIDVKHKRGDVYQDQAMDALNKWRRYHTRAKINDLIEALQKLHRLDLAQAIEKNILKPKHLLDVDDVQIDPRKKEIDELNRKLNRLFEKMRNSTLGLRETYTYSRIGLDEIRPLEKSELKNLQRSFQSQASTSMQLSSSLQS